MAPGPRKTDRPLIIPGRPELFNLPHDRATASSANRLSPLRGPCLQEPSPAWSQTAHPYACSPPQGSSGDVGRSSGLLSPPRRTVTWILCQSDLWNFLSQHAHLPAALLPGTTCSLTMTISMSLPPPAPTDLGWPSLRRILSPQLWPESHFPLSCFQIYNTRGMTTPTPQCSWDSRTRGLVLGKWERPLAQGEPNESPEPGAGCCCRPGITLPCRQQSTGQPCLTPGLTL